MVRTKLKMNSDLKEAFSIIKPVCDVLMVCPSLESLTAYSARVSELKKEVVQELQQYLLYPLISRIKCNEIRRRIEMHLKILEAVRTVLEKITVNSFEMYMKLETGLLSIIFDSHRQGMISDASEEVKYSTIRCLTVLMLNIPHEFRLKLLKNQVPMLAQAVFVSVHIAKLERLRVLRLAAIQCVTAHTMTHPQLTVEYRMPDPELELLAVDNMLSSILPGVLAALQDVCACTDNPTHVVVAAAIEAIHRILCIPMHDKYLAKKPITTQDFVTMLKEKKAKCDTEVSNKVQKSPKDMAKRSEEWFTMAGEKLTLITKSLVSLRVHEHYKVRKELAIFCCRIMTECSTTMPASIPLCLDVVISLSKDDYPEVSNYCTAAVSNYFANAPEHARSKTMDSLCDNFISLLISLPRILNNIDESRKLSVLNLLHGYIQALMSGSPERLTGALSVAAHMQHLCTALAAAAHHDTRVVTHAARQNLDVSSPPAAGAPWSRLQHLQSDACAARLQQICALLGGAECAELVLDVLLDRFHTERDCEPVYILNWMISSSESTASMARRMIYAYIDQEAWDSPVEVGSQEPPVAPDESLDVSVYNPRAWTKDSVPDLYEGTVETRYTGITYSAPRVAYRRDPRYCATLAEAQKNLVLACLLTEGLGLIANRLQAGYNNYLLKTLCPILERVGSEYELLHLAGLKAINLIAHAGGHATVGQLICVNADYFTNLITARLRKGWSCESALTILTVVMEYSDPSVADFLYGIVEDVLVQSCDKYYSASLPSYLQAFLTCVQTVRKWFPPRAARPRRAARAPDLLAEVREYVKDTQEAERLLSDTDFEKTSGKSVEEMYREDLKRSEEEVLDYDDTVTNESTPPPRHALVTITILKRCLHFVTSPKQHEAILALQILDQGLPVLRAHEDELLPLVHLIWAPLVARFHSKEPVVLRRAFDLLVTLAALSKDFIHSRTVKEVLPEVYKFLDKSSKDSYLKDTGSAYRNSQAFSLQLAALRALPSLAADLGLADERLTDAMTCVQTYLSNRQPKPLQALAVEFFKAILEYSYEAAWFHLRKFCDNDEVLQPPPAPPAAPRAALQPVRGSPYHHKDKEYDTNVKLIFDFMVS